MSALISFAELPEAIWATRSGYFEWLIDDAARVAVSDPQVADQLERAIPFYHIGFDDSLDRDLCARISCR